MAAEVRVRSEDLLVVGHGRILFVGALGRERADLIALGTLDGVGPASLSSLRQALIRWRAKDDDPECGVLIGLWQAPEEEIEQVDHFFLFDFIGPDGGVYPSSPMLFLEGDRLRVRIDNWTQTKPDIAKTSDLLAPFFERLDASYEVDVAEDEKTSGRKRSDEQPGFTLKVDIDPPGRRGESVADVWKLAGEALALLNVKKGDEIPRLQALDLLRAGKWDLFRGQPESEWLDVKGAPYTQGTSSGEKEVSGDSKDHWKHDLAKDVAAFANSPDGGMIVIGMTTEMEDDIETIEKVRELELSRVTPSRYRQVIAQWVFPEVSGFAIEKLEGETPGRGLVLLIVPRQPEARRPFLVHGGVVAGKLRKHYVLLPFRRADETAFGDIGSLHTRLRLGELVIAGERQIRKTS